jgi:hypothetical protein
MSEIFHRIVEHFLHSPPLSLWQNIEFPVLLVPLYVRVASLFYIERVGPDQF